MLLLSFAVTSYGQYIESGGPKNSYKNTTVPVFMTNLVKADDIPETFDWGNVGGKSYLTAMRNQHIPQYCGSCWAFGAVSALQDRIKIQRKGMGEDVTIAVQHILNCQGGGSCYGGSHFDAYNWMQNNEVAFEDANPYSACSSDSKAGLCPHGEWTCESPNIARTCGGFPEMGGKCVGLSHYPNITVAEYGQVPNDPTKIQIELMKKGPLACGVNANPLRDYESGVFTDDSAGSDIDHVVSIVGWGVDNGVPYWRVRNSWGSYWGEMGFFRVKRGTGTLGLEQECAWATPGQVSSTNFPCHEDGSNCVDERKEREENEELIFA